MVEDDAHQQVGYILRSYPRLSQTFILNEILALERLGMSLEIFALTDPHEDLRQSRVADIRAQVHYLEAAGHMGRGKNLLQHLEVLLSSPIRYFRSLLFVLKESYLDAGYRTATRFECFSMAVYLVWLIKRQHRRSERRTIHLHAHFAHDPALIALLAHKISGISYSFTAHARDLYQLAVPALQERSKWASAVVTCCAANQGYLAGVISSPLQAKVRLIHHKHPSGFFLGAWASNVDETISDGNSEIDLYGGYKGQLFENLSYDLSIIYYWYPGGGHDPDWDYVELHGGLNYAFANLPLEPNVGVGFNYSPDFYGEDGCGYFYNGTLRLTLPYSFGLGFELGYQDVKGDKTTPNGYDYLFWKIGLSKEVLGFNLDVSYYDTNEEEYLGQIGDTPLIR